MHAQKGYSLRRDATGAAAIAKAVGVAGFEEAEVAIERVVGAVYFELASGGRAGALAEGDDAVVKGAETADARERAGRHDGAAKSPVAW